MELQNRTRELNKELFEKAIIVGKKKADICFLFNTTIAELDEFCKLEYNNNFETVYRWIRMQAAIEYRDILADLAMRGNSKAMDLITRFVDDEADETMDNGIVFNVNVKTVGEEDKNGDN